MENILYPTMSNFDSLILANKRLTVVDFWATWCGPCKMLLPIVEQLATELAGKVDFAKINVDEQVELAERFGIETIPTLLFIKDGAVVGKSIGFRQKVQLVDMISKAENNIAF